MPEAPPTVPMSRAAVEAMDAKTIQAAMPSPPISDYRRLTK
ncbi:MULTISPECIES: hypothetical protein [Streptomyces]|nr:MULTISPECIES: hypothetical protein [Streptomyces]GGS13022.1 hypothetical protein GCM10010236_79240 [Streptomyces eurythermus]